MSNTRTIIRLWLVNISEIHQYSLPLWQIIVNYYMYISDTCTSWTLCRTGDVTSQMQMQYRASAVDKMKIEPAMILCMENTVTHHPRWRTKIMIVLQKKLQIILCFLRVPNWQQVVRMVRSAFLGRIKLKSSSRMIVLVLFRSSIHEWFFLVVSEDWMTASIDL